MDILALVDYAYMSMIHTLKDKADWEYISPRNYNTWQKIAVATRGFITPGNFASLLGFALVILGLSELVDRHFFIGSILLALGRLCDLLDGTLAEYTGTKCQVGEILDTGTDKLAIFLSLIVLALNDLTPAYIVVAILGLNIASVSISLIARVRRIVIHPSKAGKFFTALSWVVIISYLYSYAVSGVAQDILRVVAYISFVGTIGLGLFALAGYSQAAFAKRKPNEEAQFEHVLVVQNPKSSHNKRAERRTRELKKLYGHDNITTITTSADPKKFAKDFTAQLARIPKPALLCIGGGDGTVHAVVELLMKHDNKNVTLLPLWGGNANDFAYMLNGLSVTKKLRTILQLGRSVAIYPLEITLQKGKSTTTHYAICYASFGASAYAAHHLDTVAISRKGPLHNIPVILMLREAFQVFRALVQAPTFKAKIEGRQVEIFEQVFTNGSRIAKIDRLPVKLHDKAFYRANHLPDKHPSLPIRLYQILRGKQVGKTSSKPHSFTTTEKILAQLDGEVTKIAADTKVTVSIAKQPVHAISIKL